MNNNFDIIAVVLPRDIIMSALNQGIEFANNNQFLRDNIEVGLAFISMMETTKDISFIVPVFYNHNDHLEILNNIQQSVTITPTEVVNIIRNAQTKYHILLKELILKKQESDYNHIFQIPLKRASDKHRVNMKNYDVQVNSVPNYWYTTENDDLEINKGFLWKLWIKGLLHNFIKV